MNLTRLSNELNRFKEVEEVLARGPTLVWTSITTHKAHETQAMHQEDRLIIQQIELIGSATISIIILADQCLIIWDQEGRRTLRTEVDQEHVREVTTIEILASYQLITSHLTWEETLIHELAPEYNRQATVLITESRQILELNSQQLEPKTAQPGEVRAPGSTLTYNHDCIIQRLEIHEKVHSQWIISPQSDALETESHLFKEIDSASITVELGIRVREQEQGLRTVAIQETESLRWTIIQKWCRAYLQLEQLKTVELTVLRTRIQYLVDFMEEPSLECLLQLAVYLKTVKLQMNVKVVLLYLRNILASSILKEEEDSINSRIRTSLWQISET